ncbi:MAG TPA: glycosyltransferase family 39 protein [Bacteroidia bacterium]|nr:glycosyltransferase family 39 protein [Bacteroidia bacterium]
MNRKTIYLLSAILFIGFFCRSFRIDKFGLSYDEQVSILIAEGKYHGSTDLNSDYSLHLSQDNSFGNVIAGTVFDNGNSVAYNIFLHYWLLIFGSTAESARELSIVFGLLLIPLGYAFSKIIFENENAGCLTALLLALHPLLTEFAHVARAYTMATFFSTLSSYFFYRMISGTAKNKTFAFYVVASVTALLSHYLTSYIFIAHGLIFLLFMRHRILWMKYLTANFIIGCMFLLWFFSFGKEGVKVMDALNSDFTTRAADFTAGDNPFVIPATAKNIFTCWLQIWLQMFGDQLQNFGLRIREVAVLVLLPFSILYFFLRQIKNTSYEKSAVVFLLAMTFVQTLFLTALAVRAGHCISLRPVYANFATPYAIILLAHSIFISGKVKQLQKPVAAITAAIILIMVLSLVPGYLNKAKKFPEKTGAFPGDMEKLDCSGYCPVEECVFTS